MSHTASSQADKSTNTLQTGARTGKEGMLGLTALLHGLRGYPAVSRRARF